MGEQIYHVVSDPYTDDYSIWHMDILYFDDEEGKESMQRGTITIPDAKAGYAIQKYFRQNVNPLDNKQLNKIIDESVKGIMQ